MFDAGRRPHNKREFFIIEGLDVVMDVTSFFLASASGSFAFSVRPAFRLSAKVLTNFHVVSAE